GLKGGHRDAQGQAVVGGPSGRGDLVLVPGDFFAEGTAHALQRAALKLIAQADGIGDRAAICGSKEALHLDASGGAINLGFSDEGYVTIVAFVGDAGDATSSGDAGS